MGWTDVATAVAGTVYTAARRNTEVRDNLAVLRTGGLALAGQAVNLDVVPSSATQLAISPAGRQLRQSFRGLQVRTHPDSDKAASRLMLVHAEEIVFDDGTRIAAGLDRLVADITVGGAGGLDTGAEGASRWYEFYVIRKSSDGTLNALLHRALDYLLDQSQTTDDTNMSLGSASTDQRLAQSFVPATSGPLPFIDVKLVLSAAPLVGNVWFTLEADSAGAPSGAALATSDKIDTNRISTSAQIIRFAFRNPSNVIAATTYWLVARIDYSTGGNIVRWRANTAGGYASGKTGKYNGSAWSEYSAGYDAWFKTYITENDTAVIMPDGYDQKCLATMVRNDAGSDFIPFRAIDREVVMPPVANAVSNGSAAFQTLVDLSAFVPPRAVMISKFEIANHGAVATQAYLSPGIYAAGYYLGAFWAVGAFTDTIDLGTAIPVDYQHIYYMVVSGALDFGPIGFKW